MRVIELESGKIVGPSGPDGPGSIDARRSPGAHVSELIRQISNSVLMKGQRKHMEELSPSEKSRMGVYVAMGWAWEAIVREALVRPLYGTSLEGKFMSPGELTLDGISGTPDWLDSEEGVLEEFKATWRSSARPLDPDFWSWLVQIKAYCKMLQTREARLRCFFVNGNYRESGPQVKYFQLTFGKQEISDNWDMLVRQHESTLKNDRRVR